MIFKVSEIYPDNNNKNCLLVVGNETVLICVNNRHAAKNGLMMSYDLPNVYFQYLVTLRESLHLDWDSVIKNEVEKDRNKDYQNALVGTKKLPA